MPESESPTLVLGLRGAFRLLISPVVQLTPDVGPPQKLEQLSGSLKLEGACVNLVEQVPCRLEWRVETNFARIGLEAAGSPPIPHPRSTVIVPSGDRYVVKEEELQKDGTKKEVDLVFDAFALKAFGKGALGYTLTLEMVGDPSVTLAPQASPLKVELPIEVSIEVVNDDPLVVVRPRTEGETATVEQGLVAPAEPTLVPLPAPNAEGVPTQLIGTRLQFSIQPCAAFAGQTLTFSVGEHQSSRGELGEFATAHRWTVSAAPELTKLEWCVGMAQASANHLFGLAPSHVSQPGELRHFAWTVLVEPPPPPGPPPAPDPKVLPRRLSSELQPFCDAKHPSLSKLFIQRETRNGELLVGVAGVFDGFAPYLEFDLELELMVETKPATDDANSPLSLLLLSKVLAEVHSGEGVLRSAPVKHNGFSVTAFNLSGCKDLLQGKDPSLKLFAAIRFAPSGLATEGHAVFESVAGYVPNIKSDSHSEGHAPFASGSFAPPDVATGVCTQLMDLEGNGSELVATAVVVPKEKYQDYSWFLAAMVGEAGGCSDGALLGVAHTIMNRVGSKVHGWEGWTTVMLAVKALGQFESCTGSKKNPYPNEAFKTGLIYFDQRYIKNDPSAVAQNPKLAHLEEICIPIFLRLNPEDTGEGVTHFFSPKLQNSLGRTDPNWASSYVEVTPHFVSNSDTSFRFFAMKRG